VLVLLRGKAQQDRLPLRVAFARGQQLVRVRGLDFPPPHTLHGRQIAVIHVYRFNPVNARR
jgi:hypothetical protein